MMPVARLFLIVTLAGAASVLTGCKSEKRDEPRKPDPAAASAPAARPAADSGDAPPVPVTTRAAAAETTAAGFSTADDYTVKSLTRIDLASGLVIEDLKVGQGEAALPRATVTFHYRAKIEGDREFHSTLAREGGPKPEVQPLNKLFRGLNDGMIGMQKGGRRRITVPPQLAPGIVGMKDADGNILIPPGAVLVYVVDVLEVQQPVLTVPASPTPPAATPPAATAPTTPAQAPAPGKP